MRRSWPPPGAACSTPTPRTTHTRRATMAVEFLMPKLGLTMEEGTILQWLVDDGATVRAGMPVMLIETDKVESEVEVSGPGRLHRLGAEGDTFTCGAVVGL